MSKKQLTKHEMLFIRACKVEQPIVRLMTLRNRLYLRNEDENSQVSHLGSILADLCDKFELLTISKMVYGMRDVNREAHMQLWLTQEHQPFRSTDESILRTLIHAIRWAKWEELGEFIPVRRFRRKEIIEASAKKLAKMYTESNSGV